MKLLLVLFVAVEMAAQSELTFAWNERALRHQEAGQFAEAREAYLAAIAVEDLTKASAATRLRLYLNLVAVELEMGERESAAKRVREARLVANELPENSAELAGLHSGIGSLEMLEGRLTTAYGEFTKALEILQRVGGRAEDVSGVLQNMGAVLIRQGKYAEARREFARAVELMRGGPQLVRALAGLSGAEYRLGNYEAADRAAGRAVELAVLLYGQEHWMVRGLVRNRAVIVAKRK
ncbi:MAG: tetratricopeptide repeat protein [Acidobacteria bacterium]|nr:tetratricopeptide repeat protein [Acidobacteriota bacterium]